MRKQIAFASLNEAEIDQIAEWLRHETYETVHERVRKPRSEGGFGLNISRSPLERLHDKTNKAFNATLALCLTDLAFCCAAVHRDRRSRSDCGGHPNESAAAAATPC